MEKEETLEKNKKQEDNSEKSELDIEPAAEGETEKEKLSSEDKIKELEDKLTRTFAEMENQRRRFEKEKDEAFDYGGFSFAKEALNLLDNLERSKLALENDESLKGSESLKKITEHLNIVYSDMLLIFKIYNI